MKLNLSTYLFKKIQRQEQHTFIEIDTLICKFYTFIDLVYPSSVALVCRVTSPFTWSSERLKPEWEKEKITVVGNRGLAQAIARAIFNGKYDKREVFMIRKMDLAWEISCFAVFFFIFVDRCGEYPLLRYILAVLIKYLGIWAMPCFSQARLTFC